MAIGDGTYRIDGNLVNNRVDWRFTSVPAGLTARQVHIWPGDRRKYVVKGLPLDMDLIVTGWLVDSSDWGSLDDQLRTYQAMLGDLTTHTIKAHDQSTYTEMDLKEFSVIKTQARANSAGTLFAARRVRFYWENTDPQ